MSAAKATPHLSPPRRPIPPLVNGDHLTREEFERRYEAMPQVKKAELIEGVVYMGSPVSIQHSEPHAAIVAWLVNYQAQTPGVAAGDNGTLRLDHDNEPQPDAYLRIIKGQSRVGEKKYLIGAPELIVEIAASSTSIDLHRKLSMYRRCGVKEYVVWRVEDDAIDWFQIVEGKYAPQEPQNRIMKSCTFPGLWLDVAAMLAGDFVKVMAVLRQGLADPSHAAFVKQLQKAAKAKE